MNPQLGLLCGYVWRRADFPWLGMWDEHRDRVAPPWGGRTVARGLEFGLSPFAHGKAAMQKLGSLFGVPVLGTLKAGETRKAAWRIFIAPVPAGCAGVQDVAGSPDGGSLRVTLAGGSVMELA